MGRKPTRWMNLPVGMRARPRGRLIHYYLDTGGKPRKEIPLGSEYIHAVRKWAELTSKKLPSGTTAGTFAEVLEHYWRDIVPTKGPTSQYDNEAQKYWLLKFFNEPPAPIDAIEPVHIRQYLDWRVREAKKAATVRYAKQHGSAKPMPPLPPKYGQVRANRDKALLSHIWNYARERGFTKAPNPCQGVKAFREEGRDTYVDDELLARVMKHAVRPLQLALRLAHLTGQRPGDVLRMSEADIGGGVLRVKQSKTKAKLRIVIEGELAALLDEIAAYKDAHMPKTNVRSPSLLVSELGTKLTAAMLH